MDSTEILRPADYRGRMPLPPDPELQLASAVLRLLSNRTRLAMLALLHDEEMAVTAIAQELGAQVPAISQHLARLRALHLVEWRREGTTIFYCQPDVHLHRLVTNALQFAEHQLYEVPPHHGGDHAVASGAVAASEVPAASKVAAAR